ncbi:MAG: 5-deoxy-glucuronate isomerase [bacterium (Candidatus Ratteibacteria) CG_4_10_14_3_um_filter_41_18]|uniref:5-deoxy-glucuronate isomerase n=1 Tax=bacterium (Candidatus Ratteibacteria) CG_4_10_14_3_um_filter_41_18 TaxID=2014287 RepID=A0A2M7M4Y0_9BACT|nr:MAG: 5-deoxy-glucuronate isomerase [bacterium (Candidatus Ratteibacteria) CG_4_10_14_3_um_filter_41_18]
MLIIRKKKVAPLSKELKSLKLIELGLVCLKKNGTFAEKIKGQETVLVILGGQCRIKTGNYSFPLLGKRKDPFAGKATALYLPPYTSYDIIGESDCEIAVCKVRARRKGKPILISPDKVRLRKAGKDNFKRDVYDIVDERIKAEHIVVGETINEKGNWSSYPPHKHDRDNLPLESKQEELYFFKLEPPDGFGVIRLYNKKSDKIFTIKNNDVIAIPRGYHPVGVIPGYRIYYLWILAGKKRILKPSDDPKYSWVKEEG